MILNNLFNGRVKQIILGTHHIECWDLYQPMFWKKMDVKINPMLIKPRMNSFGINFWASYKKQTGLLMIHLGINHNAKKFYTP